MVGKGGRRGTSWGNNWNYGATKVIRVPAALENQILEYAKALDSKQIPLDSSELQAAILLAIDQFVEQRIKNFHPNQYSRSGNTHSRRWDELRKFRKFVADSVTTSESLPKSEKTVVELP